MFLRRTATSLARRAAASPVPRRSFTSSFIRRDVEKPSADLKIKKFEGMPYQPYSYLSGRYVRAQWLIIGPRIEIQNEHDLIPPGAPVGTVPTDLEQSTGLERLEILGKMQGVDIFDMKPLDASRKGTLDNPIVVKSFGDEQYAGCTGYPADSHVTIWLTVGESLTKEQMSRDRPVERCPECGNVLKMEYVGPQDDPHAHDHGHADGHHNYEEPKTFADYVRPEYR
ncbi:MAG: Cytochrome c oxidase subunit 4 [Vezdaea acicularis]|nr:MAG: Cytochrome c oxidase subunit 4 [Vezdaea acicularis]